MAEKKRKYRHNHHPVNEGNLMIATLLNLVISIVEIAGGILSNSLALLSDALHNLSDAFSTFIAYVAIKMGKRSPTPILAAMLNAIILIIICFYLFREAWERLQDPQPIKSLIVIVVAMVGLIANVLAVALLRKDSKKNINVKAAYVHLIGDSLSSIVVIIAAVAIQLFEIFWLDPVITVAIGLYLIRESYLILKEAVNIVMQSAPDQLDIEKIRRKIESLPEVYNIHHIHAWNLTEHELFFEAHIELAEDVKLSQLKSTQEKIETLLKKQFHINHTTLQFEYDSVHEINLVSKRM